MLVLVIDLEQKPVREDDRRRCKSPFAILLFAIISYASKGRSLRQHINESQHRGLHNLDHKYPPIVLTYLKETRAVSNDAPSIATVSLREKCLITLLASPVSC